MAASWWSRKKWFFIVSIFIFSLSWRKRNYFTTFHNWRHLIGKLKFVNLASNILNSPFLSRVLVWWVSNCTIRYQLRRGRTTTAHTSAQCQSRRVEVELRWKVLKTHYNELFFFLADYQQQLSSTARWTREKKKLFKVKDSNSCGVELFSHFSESLFLSNAEFSSHTFFLSSSRP